MASFMDFLGRGPGMEAFKLSQTFERDLMDQINKLLQGGAWSDNPMFKQFLQQMQSANKMGLNEALRAAQARGVQGGALGNIVSESEENLAKQSGMAGNQFIQNMLRLGSGEAKFNIQQGMDVIKQAMGAMQQKKAMDEAESEAKKQQLMSGLSSLLTPLAGFSGSSGMSGISADTKIKNPVTGAMSTVGGGGCCFIFLEGGLLTGKVKELRDELFTKDSYVAKGYRKMAEWLVPWMRKSQFIKKIVIKLMLKPIATYSDKRNGFFIPVCIFWCLVWDLYGRLDGIST